MGIKQVTVGIQRIINLGNYENVRYECSVVVDVDPVGSVPNAGPDQAYKVGLAFCKEKVGEELERLQPSKKSKS